MLFYTARKISMKIDEKTNKSYFKQLVTNSILRLATVRIAKQRMFPLWSLTRTQFIELLVTIEISLRACRNKRAR